MGFFGCRVKCCCVWAEAHALPLFRMVWSIVQLNVCVQHACKNLDGWCVDITVEEKAQKSTPARCCLFGWWTFAIPHSSFLIAYGAVVNFQNVLDDSVMPIVFLARTCQ